MVKLSIIDMMKILKVLLVNNRDYHFIKLMSAQNKQ